MGLHLGNLRGLLAKGVYGKVEAKLEERRLGSESDVVERTVAVGITYVAKMIAGRG
jgi:hypothetical protein